jgi:hypothetical protein
MEWIIKLMNWELLSLGENSVTIGQLVAALLTVSIALILAAWLIRQLTKRLLDGGKDANVVQLIKKVWRIRLYFWCDCHRHRIWSAEHHQQLHQRMDPDGRTSDSHRRPAGG